MDILDRINYAYRNKWPGLIKGNESSSDDLETLLSDLSKLSIIAFEETMITAAKRAYSLKNEESIYNILEIMDESRITETYGSDFKNTKKEIRDYLNRIG